MRKFRRSTKSSDKTDSVGSGRALFIPPKDPTAIVPPKKVIKALYTYQVQNPAENPDYLSFDEGDFLHVVGRENDPDWYEACNPVVGRRGLVPVNHFEEVGKQGRASQGSGIHSRSQSAVGHDSGYHEQASAANGAAALANTFAHSDGAQPRMSRLARGSGAMVYGIVQYDFKAERSDELDAKAGEAIIVIAQSNPEWFVAKPIQRLGGPGLIPVSFIEIRDMSTGQAVPNAHEAVRKAGVPKVEEWKAMAAEYKNSSIPLGRLDVAGGTTTQSQSMDRLSQNSSTRQSQNAERYTSDPRAYGQSGAQRSTGHGMSQVSNQVSNHRSMPAPTPASARVPRYIHERDEFWFIVEAIMEDGRSYDLLRSYKDFYGLQLVLKEQFPEEAGAVQGCPRTLPLMPGPVPWVSEHITSERRHHLDKYLKDLLSTSSNITSSSPVRNFFVPREGDQEAQHEEFNDPDDMRLSQGSSLHSGQIDSRQSSTGNVSSTAGTVYASPQRVPQQSHHVQSPYGQKPPPGHYRNASDLRVPNGSGGSFSGPPVMRNGSAMNSASNISQSSSAPVKVKVWFGDSNIVVLRLPPSFGYGDLLQKIRERWSLEPGVDKSSLSDSEFQIEWKDEQNSLYHPLDSEDDLHTAREQCEKLTLRVEAPGG